MTTELQRQGLGIFADLGFTLDHDSDITVRLLHEGNFVARFSQLGATEESIQGECANHLGMEHGWDGCIWKEVRDRKN